MTSATSSFSIGSNSVEQTIELGRKMSKVLKDDDVVVLCGDLGAGKTHFTKGVAKGFGIDSEITSPTFNILRMYEVCGNPNVTQLAHWDVYRLEEEDQLDDVDYFGIVESGCVSLVEWGDKFPGALPDEYVRVDISLVDADSRIVEFTGFGDRGQQIVKDLEAALG